MVRADQCGQLSIRVKETKRPLELVRLLPKGRKKVELLIISTGFACSHATVLALQATASITAHRGSTRFLLSRCKDTNNI